MGPKLFLEVERLVHVGESVTLRDGGDKAAKAVLDKCCAPIYPCLCCRA